MSLIFHLKEQTISRAFVFLKLFRTKVHTFGTYSPLPSFLLRKGAIIFYAVTLAAPVQSYNYVGIIIFSIIYFNAFLERYRTMEFASRIL